VSAGITNDDYIDNRNGRTVTVYGVDDPAAQDKNSDNSVQIQNVSGGAVDLTMDQEKDITIGIGVVDEFQSRPDVRAKFRERQVQIVEEDVDKYVLGLYGQADSNNQLSTSATTASGFDDKIREAKVALSDQNVPRSNRWMVLTPTYADLAAEAAGDRIERNTEIEREGYIGRYQGFDMYETSLVQASSGNDMLMFGHTAAITLAVRPQEFNLVPNAEQASFHGDVLKGLFVYGAQTFIPEALGSIEITA
jgi:hypothetical protein